MSDQNLEYTLNVLVDDADKRMQALFKSWEKAASGVATSFAKGLADAAKSAGKADGLGKMFESPDKAIAGTKKLTEAINQQSSAVTGSTEATAKSVNQQNALWTAVDKADASLRKQADALRGLGAAGAAEEVEKLRTSLMNAAKADSANIGNTGTALPRLNVNQFLADNRQMIQGYDDQIKKEREVSKTSVESHSERIRQAEKLNATEAQIRATRYSDNAQFQSVVKAQEVETAAFLTNLRARSVGMTKAQVESEISEHQRLAAAKVSLAAEGAQAEVNAQFARATQMNKAAMAVYSVQQAVEDFSYAGMKGAMNNLSFLAMMIGGTGGLVALFGAMALNVGITSGAFDKWADSLEIAGRKTKEQADEVKRLVEAVAHFRELQFDSKQQAGRFDPTAADLGSLTVLKAAKENDIRLEKARAAEAAAAVIVYKEMEAIAKSLGSWADMGWSDFGFKNEDAEAVLQNIDLIRQEGEKVIKSHFGLMETPEKTESLRWFNEQLDRMVELDNEFRKLSGTMSTIEGFKQVQDNSEKSTKKLRDMENAARDLAAQLSLVSEMGLTPKQIQGMEEGNFKPSDNAPGGIAGKKLGNITEDTNKQWDEYVQKLKEWKDLENTKAGDNPQLKLTIAKMYIEALQKHFKAHEAIVASAEKNANILDKTVEGYEEIERSLKQQISDTERLAEASKKQLENILEQKSAWEESVTKRKAAAEDNILDLKLQESNDQVDSNLKGGLEWAKNLNESYKQNADNWAKMQKAMGGDSSAIDEYVNNWKEATQKNFENYTKGLEKQAEAAKKSNEASTNAIKKQNLDKLKDELGGKAQDAKAEADQLLGGDAPKWEQATKKYQDSLKALQELQDAQSKTIGKPTVAQAEQNKKDLEETDKKISSLYDSMAKMEEQRQQKYKADTDAQKAMVKEVGDAKMRVSSITMFNAAELGTLAAIDAALASILAKMQQIQNTQLIGTSRVAGGPISPNQPPLVTPPAAPPAAPPPVPPSLFDLPGDGGLPSIPYDGRELPPLPPSTPEQRAMEEQERATAEHWAKQKEMRDKAALDERVAAAEEQRMAKANQNARKQQQDEEIAARHKFMDELDKESPAERLKRLKEISDAAWDENRGSNWSSEASAKWNDAHKAWTTELEAQERARKALKEERALSHEDMKFAEKIQEQDNLALEELKKKGWDNRGFGPEFQNAMDESEWGDAAMDKKRRRREMDDARRKAGLPREDWKKQDYEEALKAEQRVQNIQKQTQAEQASIDALSQAKEKAEAKAKARAEAKAKSLEDKADALHKKSMEAYEKYQELAAEKKAMNFGGDVDDNNARQKKVDDAAEEFKRLQDERVKADEAAFQIRYRLKKAEKAGVDGVTQSKEKANSIPLVSPSEIGVIEGVNSQLERTLALVQSIAAASSIGSGMGGGGGAGGGAGGGRGGGGGSIANNITINTSAASSSVLSANLAAAAAAQSLAIMRR